MLASSLKRALLRKDSTFSEADYGFRAFGELLRHLEAQGVIELVRGPGPGRSGGPVPVDRHQRAGGLRAPGRGGRRSWRRKNGPVVLSGLKNQLRKQDPDFSEKKFGYGGFLQFCKAAATKGVIELTWDDARRRLSSLR